ncbi:phage tail tape measure protein [Blastococcus sp. TF02A-35]|uniref:phage tail tape measure protein n=1 Tax=Blastococcus sp. TF02A-35 TaxID=2559612 RepID=UPI00107450FF|nr:phage tail tape measure protein [Blastococcus sp. TF02A_35]TFV49540.1 phage tail tape measure protein [Blastococcus sp. TF02A_35]
MPRVLETILTARNLLSPELLKAAKDVTAFSAHVAAANERAATSATTSARAQAAATTAVTTASNNAAAATTSSAARQAAAADKIALSNVKASTSATASAQAQARAHSAAAQSATTAARVQESANLALTRSNGLLVGSLGPLATGLGATALALGYAGYRGMEFDSAMSQVRAASQATGATLNELRETAIQAGADTQYSAVEAAQGITELSKAGVQTTDIINGGLKGALDLAAAGQMEVADAAELGATALNVFNLRGDQMNHVADLLAAGAGKAQGSVHDLGMALNQSALVASATGLTIEETTGALAAFASEGLIGSDAGTSFRQMLLHLQAPSEKAAGVMSDLGISLYDANGKFVGMTTLAGQLQSRMGHLTQQQRDQAMATIFGADAVRASNILFEQGATGLQQWIDKTNDAGFAQRQAADLTNNLRGDLERLGGAVDAVFTQMGDGAQGPLRLLVQGLTGLVTVAGDIVSGISALPTPVLAAAAAWGVFRLATGPLAGTLSATGTAIQNLTTSMSNAVGSAAGLRAAASGLVGAFGGPWGLAITGATLGLGSLVSWLDQSSVSTEQAASYQQRLADALEESNGALNENVRAIAAREAADTKIGDSNLLSVSRELGLDLPKVTDALLGNEAAYGELRTATDAYLQKALEAADFNSEDPSFVAAMDKVDGYRGALEELFPDLAGMKQGQEDVAAATAETGGAMEASAGHVRDFGAEADEAKKAVDALKAGLDALTGATVTTFEAESQLAAAVDEAIGAVDGLTGSVLNADGTLNAYSESGRQAGDVLLEVRDKGNQLISTLRQQGATEDEVRARDAQLRQSFIDTAARMGISSQAANRLADDILGIPDQRLTRITADASQANAEIDALENKIRTAGGRVVYTAPNVRNVTGISARAAGGIIEGPGTGTSDSILGIDRQTGAPTSWVSAGEFVVNKRVTDENRQLIEAINAGRLTQKDVLPLLAAGGRVEGGTTYYVGMGPAKLAELEEALLERYGEPSGGGSANGLLPIMAAARQYVMDVYGVRNIGGFAKRNIAGTNTPSDHGMGKAIDVMTSNLQLGWAIANDFAFGAASNRFRAENVIWQQSISSNGGPFKRMADRGSPTQNHYDHVHIDTFDRGGVAVGQGYLPKATIAPERVLDPRQTQAFEEWMARPAAAMPGYGMAPQMVVAAAPAPPNVTVEARVFLGDREITDIVRIESRAVVDGRLEDYYRQRVRR